MLQLITDLDHYEHQTGDLADNDFMRENRLLRGGKTWITFHRKKRC